MFKYLSTRALNNMQKVFGDIDLKSSKVFHTVTLYVPEEKENKNLDMFFLSPTFRPIQRLMANRFPNDFLRAMSDHIITSVFINVFNLLNRQRLCSKKPIWDTLDSISLMISKMNCFLIVTRPISIDILIQEKLRESTKTFIYSLKVIRK